MLKYYLNTLCSKIKHKASMKVYQEPKQKKQKTFFDFEACQLTVSHKTSLERIFPVEKIPFFLIVYSHYYEAYCKTIKEKLDNIFSPEVSNNSFAAFSFC